jgi:hypothetical protein
MDQERDDLIPDTRDGCMPEVALRRIRFCRPNIPALTTGGYYAADMHVHTTYSDAGTSVREVVARAFELGIGLSITDHNMIGGVLEAASRPVPEPFVPGIEVSTSDGPHILLYFPSVHDLLEFYSHEVRNFLGDSPYLAIHKTSAEVLGRAATYDCLSVAAHPFGYWFFDKGLCKCIGKGSIKDEVRRLVQAMEVICGGMSRGLNLRACHFARTHHTGITGGTDCHILRHFGTVITACKAGGAREFLEEIRAGRSVVEGEETGVIGKGISGGVILGRFLPYTLPSIKVHYRQNTPRITRFFRRLMR